MAGPVTVRFLDRPGDLGVRVPRRTARLLVERHRATSHVCCLGPGVGFELEVLDRPRALPPNIREVWLLPRVPAASSAA